VIAVSAVSYSADAVTWTPLPWVFLPTGTSSFQATPGQTAVSVTCIWPAAMTDGWFRWTYSAGFPNPTLMVNALIHRLKDSLIFLIRERAASDLLMLWLLSVGAVSAWAVPERAWFIGHLVPMTVDLGIESWEDMRGALTRVIWHAVFCEDSFRDVWDEVGRKCGEEAGVQLPVRQLLPVALVALGAYMLFE